MVERRLQATRCAAITGSTISAAIRRMPTMRMETPIVSAASIDTRAFSDATGSPATRAPSSSSETAISPRRNTAISRRGRTPAVR